MARNPDRQTTFHFKHFSIDNELSAMKVGTDGVLLGAWTNVAGVKKALDVGCGTGLIALMMAQRCSAEIFGVEIDPVAALEAKGNVDKSPWPARIHIKCEDFSTLEVTEGVSFDLIVSNPPYFVGGAVAPDAMRSRARHESSLSAATVLRRGAAMLAPGGRIAFILPADKEDSILFEATMLHLSPVRLCRVSTVEGKAPTRLMVEFVHGNNSSKCEESHLDIRTSGGVYSENYINLTKDFYLKF